MKQTYPVMEIFDSIQGEGAMLGMPCTFVRFAGCNLTCEFCDTKESWNGSAPIMSETDIAEQCNRQLVVLTGGEPCMQNLTPLIDVLHEKNLLVSIETNGTLPTPENVDWVTCSPKPPEYLIHGQCFFNELKYVVTEDFTVECIPEENKMTSGSIWLQPCGRSHEKDYSDTAKAQERTSRQKCVDLAMKYPYLRVGIQLHKIMEVK